jgi:hypothetical protein
VKISLHKQVAALELLSSKIASGEIGKAKDWQGADVVISQNPLEVEPNSFYPSPRNVVSSFSSELSWLFECLRDVFISLEGYGFWKEEFFGRIGNAANRFSARNINHSRQKLLLAVIHEAHCILEEMENGDFQVLPISINNMIYDDVFREIENEGSAGAAEVDEFIKSLGITS